MSGIEIKRVTVDKKTDDKRSSMNAGPRKANGESKASKQFISPVFTLSDVAVSYGEFVAVSDVNMEIPERDVTAFIGPSGCGKSTLLRSLNRTNDLIPGAKVHGKVLYHDADLYHPNASAVEVRRRIGMVFQKPNPFPKSIYENVAFGPKVNGRPKKIRTRRHS